MYSVSYFEEVADDIKNIPGNVRKTIIAAIDLRITTDPFNYGKPLRYSWKGHRNLRVGSYHVIYKIFEEKKEIVVVTIKHRKEVYEH